MTPPTMRPTGLASPIDQRQDFTVYSGKWAIGRIYQERGMPAGTTWYWSFNGSVSMPSDMRTNGHTPTLEAAKGVFEGQHPAKLTDAGISMLREAELTVLCNAAAAPVQKCQSAPTRGRKRHRGCRCWPPSGLTYMAPVLARSRRWAIACTHAQLARPSFANSASDTGGR
jgi:hypothetical protein